MQRVGDTSSECHGRIINTPVTCGISGFHGGEYEDGCLLGCCASIIKAMTALLMEAAPLKHQ
jgi:hypothetical protein